MGSKNSKPNSNKSTSTGSDSGEQTTLTHLSNTFSDEKIAGHAAALIQLIQEHVTKFYNTGECINSDNNPFDFEPATPRCVEVALRRLIGRRIVEYINQSIESGIEDSEMQIRHEELCHQLQPYRKKNADSANCEADLLGLFESSKRLAEMLTSGLGWKFALWNEPSARTEASQIELLVFPILFKAVTAGELGSGKKQSLKKYQAIAPRSATPPRLATPVLERLKEDIDEEVERKLRDKVKGTTE
ncbi:hypothetical protein K440DRAFT_641861 [Wilcoxina mikolae CBS 423.85]|nr:hypothetical protein K440DRAFT_641861 [Wilcoxina mikolae CBS 423.85]